MSTIYNFNEELPSVGGGAGIADITFLYQNSSGRVKQLTVSQSRYKTVTASTNVGAGSSAPIASANSTNTTSTLGFISANEGVANIQATTSGGMVVLPPTAAGQELVIASPNLKSTGVFQIQVSSSYGSSTPSYDGTNTILQIPSSTPWGVTLMSVSTSKWAIMGVSNALATLNTTNWSLSTGG